jgi:hypothetical protein
VPAVKTQLEALAALVVKDGVGVGRLTEPQRMLVLGLAWCSLPARIALREADVNAALKRALAGPCCFLGIDHVELRRWLVDTGWMQRDGFGREYRRVDAAALAQSLQSLTAVLTPMDLGTWVNGLRGAAATRREQRRQAWKARGAEAAHE